MAAPRTDGQRREACTVELLDGKRLAAQVDELSARDRDDYLQDLTRYVAALVVNDDDGALGRLRDCFAMWRLRLSLEASPCWQDQLAAVERRIAAGDLGEAISIDDLPRLFPVD